MSYTDNTTSRAAKEDTVDKITNTKAHIIDTEVYNQILDKSRTQGNIPNFSTSFCKCCVQWNLPFEKCLE